jgi:hypothetical protein
MFAKQSDSLDIRIWITEAEAKQIKPGAASSLFLTTFLDSGIEITLSSCIQGSGKPQMNVDIAPAKGNIARCNVQLGREAYERLLMEKQISERCKTFSTSKKLLIAIDDTIAYNPFDMGQFQNAVRIYLECADIDFNLPSIRSVIGRGIVELKKNDRFELILGFKEWQHARLIYGIPNGKKEYCFWVDTNDDGDENDPNCPYRENHQLKSHIEAYWQRAGLPVRKK